MKQLLIASIVLGFTAPQVSAQDADAPTLMERGARQFLEGLFEDVEPALNGALAFLEEMGPAFGTLMEEIKDWSVYEAPEILPNGDIIIRRKPKDQSTPANPPQVDL